MITLIIGHRGVGKTLFLQRIKGYYFEANRSCQIYDLDEEIEKNEKKSIFDLFSIEGESNFRETEERIFKQLISTVDNYVEDVYIALGAGFQFNLPDYCRVLWLQRETDACGRVFLNRPRLNSSVSGLDEYLERFFSREVFYGEYFWETLGLLEGQKQESLFEKQCILSDPKFNGGILTLSRQHFDFDQRANYFLDRRKRWGYRFFELRDDYFEDKQWEGVVEFLGEDRVLFSFRNEAKGFDSKVVDRIPFWDWAMELGGCPMDSIPMLSLHEREQDESAEQVLSRLDKQENCAKYIKLACEVNNFKELERFHRWMMESPQTRWFYPRSNSGRWQWYRLLNKRVNQNQFIREGHSSFLDQPLLQQWFGVPEQFIYFSALLGDPIVYSYTPWNHHEFFKSLRQPIVGVQISNDEFSVETMSFLEELGLSHAAVTSPLKNLVFSWASHSTKRAQKVQSANTLIRTLEGWKADSTDEVGLSYLIKDLIFEEKGVVWGGGGILGSLKELFLKAEFYSARKGEPRQGYFQVKNKNPQFVVWACGQRREALERLMLKNWRPKIVIDLNYNDDSFGKLYAQMTGAIYRSGLEMFYRQAKEQILFWTETRGS